MAIIPTATLGAQLSQAVAVSVSGESRRDRREASKDARRVLSLLAKLDAPSKDVETLEWADDLDGIDPERLVLVFTNEPPLPVSVAEMPSIGPFMPRFKQGATAQDVRALLDALSDGLAATTDVLGVPLAYDEEMDAATGGRVRFSPLLSEEECALAAFRALLSEAHEWGAVQAWDVQLWSEERGTWELRRYLGTEAALRRTFPDWDELERMRAAGTLGIPQYGPDPGQHWPAPGPIEFQGYEAPSVPYRLRRHS